MCGRFSLFDSVEALSRAFGIPDTLDLTPRYNIAPSQPVLAVRVSPESGRREASWFRWGLIPRWAKDSSIGNRMINARAETVAEKPAFRDAFRRRRCLVPSSGFYEWRKQGARKQPFYIRMRDARPLAFAGLWEHWESTDGSSIETCTILTTAANTVLSPIHERMPAILPPSEYDPWLDSGISEQDRLLPLLRPYPAREMEALPVGTIVNDPKTDDARCIIAVDSSG